jgi:peptidoglycan-associated lipoprotein
MRITYLLLVAFIAVLTGCSSTPVAEAPASSPASAAPVAATIAPKTETPAPPTMAKPMIVPNKTEVSGATLAPHLDPANALNTKRSIYFDFDDFSIKSEFANVMSLHGAYLSKNPNLKVALEGNADERGSREYNLALGQKRAEAVAKSLALMGAPSAMLESVSLGDTKPKETGHDEKSWAANRRVDIVYKTR